MASSKLLSLALFLVLLTHANSATETSFDFPSFNKDDRRLNLQADATVSTKGQLQLTNVTEKNEPAVDSMGRAFYYAPIQIRDSTTGKLASFDTNFTFIIRATNGLNSAYGLAFALVPVDSDPKEKGKFLGLFQKSDYDPEAHTVAVVFDTSSKQIEIDLNSINPSAKESCNFNNYNGQKAAVRITYDSSSNELSVYLIYLTPGKTCRLSTTNVDLEKEVHDWVSVGFSATSGSIERTTETHNVLSWSFFSKFSYHHSPSERSNILLNNIL
uniref:ARC8 protein n=1 Tax=Phaseolus vulgaris TaxID=3885 RepID=I0J8I3_PHAVU|nr:ARC8 protein [Phaseolus vulgaris]